MRAVKEGNWASLAMTAVQKTLNQIVPIANTALVPGATATSATAGSATALPAQPYGYTTVTINGEEVLVPYYKKG